jgi:Glycosyl hydrolases family 35/Beta-galactosidase, domain 2
MSSSPFQTTRRKFLGSALAAPLAGFLGPSSGRLWALAQAPGEAQFENPHILRYDSNCFTLHRRDTFIFSASFHYPRCPQELWGDRLRKLKLAGYNTIETYVFWNYHEPQEGRADLSEFEAFIHAVKEAGFWMIARPGPYVCAEWDAGGFPHWVIAQRFPLRSAGPQSLSTSRHWYGEVMPVIQRHQITTGGPIIMVQIENEYDYWREVAEADKLAYVRALAEAAWGAGLDVPLITCWTRQARENADPAMARVTDTCNFYPRWKIAAQVPPSLAALRCEEPQSPLGVMELQGGWFSEFGGKLAVDQEGLSAAQYNLLAKTAIEQGVTYFNTYMGFGGTNFEWAAKNKTTTYDYAAPLREPGGVWEKFYAARGLGASLKLLGGALTRAQASPGPVGSTNPNVTVSVRANGASGVAFVRENAGAEQRFAMNFPDPASPTHRQIKIPREGELTLGAREMKMLPVQLAIPGGTLRYATAEALEAGELSDREFVILYDAPGRLVEIALATRDEPHVEGDTVYQYWDPEYESVVIGVRVEKAERFLLLNGHLLVILLSRERALRAWTTELPPQVVPMLSVDASPSTPPLQVPWLSDAALPAGSGSDKSRYWVDLDFAPGEHEILTFLPPLPDKCHVDGALADFQYDRHSSTARLSVAVPALPAQAIELSSLRTWVELPGARGAQVVTSPARPLEELGPLPYGYVTYSASFVYRGEARMFLSTFADDAKKVFINGKLVSEASNAQKQTDFALAPCAQSGENRVEIYYELFGSPNFGDDIGELKGVQSVRLGAEAASATSLNPWQIQLRPAAQRGARLDPEFAVGGWQPAAPCEAGSAVLVPALTWCRADFTLLAPPENWWIPWKLTFQARRDAVLYLNGRILGRYVTAGPQCDFYIPEPFLNPPGKKNVLTCGLAYAASAGPIQTLRVAPYGEFSTHRTRIEFAW